MYAKEKPGGVCACYRILPRALGVVLYVSNVPAAADVLCPLFGLSLRVVIRDLEAVDHVVQLAVNPVDLPSFLSVLGRTVDQGADVLD